MIKLLNSTQLKNKTKKKWNFGNYILFNKKFKRILFKNNLFRIIIKT